jgi:hypothetical protein
LLAEQLGDAGLHAAHVLADPQRGGSAAEDGDHRVDLRDAISLIR